MDAVVKKVDERRITNSKDLRKLRNILPDPVARAHFLKEEGELESAQLRIAPAEKKEAKAGLAHDLEAAIQSMKEVPWTALEELKGDPDVTSKIIEAEALLRSLRKALSS